MTVADPYAIPATAVAAWLALARALREAGPAPCETSSTPEAWWSYDPEAVETAVAGCSGCVVAVECGAYADAAREREGVWGGVQRRPAPRRVVSRG